MKPFALPFRNLIKRPSRSLALMLLIVLLSLSLFGGSAVVLSLKNGLKSLEDRLGADIIVIPSSAAARTNLDSLFLQGTTGYYYMKADTADKIAAIGGVEKLSTQIFLASLRADCCSAAIQVIGFDPKTDFSILPWVEESLGKPPELMELVVGSKVNINIGESFRIYGTTCPVVGRLAATGTGLDTAVYCTVDTVRRLMEAAKSLGHDLKIPGDPGEVVSAVYLKVKKGYSVDAVADNINIYVRKTKAVRTRSMLTDVSDSLNGAASVVTSVMAGVWLMSLAVLAAALTLLIHERKKEFAVLRVVGMSRGMLARMVLEESALISLAGSVPGVLAAALLVFPFSGLIKDKLGLPFLLPPPAALTLLAALSILCVVAIGTAVSFWAARKVSLVDTGTILKEDV